jgi:uncharacterized protein DUF6867
MEDLLYEGDTPGSFLFVTLLLGGGAAWLSGRAIAQTWRPWWSVAAYMLILAVAVRFIHFSLFDSTFVTPHYYAVDAAILIVIAGLGFRWTRRGQMARQYGFLNTNASPPAGRPAATP